MIYALLALTAILPSLLLIWYFHSRDVYPEPQKVIWTTFAFSILSVIPVLIIAWPVQLFLVDNITDPWFSGISTAFLVAAVPEEFFKFIVVFFYASRHKEFDEPMDGIVYGVVGSLGFATLENVLYTMQGGLAIAFARAVTAVPCHAFLGAIMGYYIGQYRFPPGEKKRGFYLFKALFWPMLLHGLYDFPLFVSSNVSASGLYTSDTRQYVIVALIGTAASVLILEWIWAVVLTKRLRKDQQVQQAAEIEIKAGIDAAPEGAGAVAAQVAVQVTSEGTLQASSALPSQGSSEAQLQAVSNASSSPPSGVWRTTKGSPWAPLLMSLGVILFTFGGFIVLGLVMAFVVDEIKQPMDDLILGGLLIGVLPFFLGLWAFIGGLKRLPKKLESLNR